MYCIFEVICKLIRGFVWGSVLLVEFLVKLFEDIGGSCWLLGIDK